MYKLHIRDDTGQATVVPVTRDRITVGREEGNTIRLTEKNVSRVHARIVMDDGKLLVEDVSRYGTRVNGLRIHSKKEVEPADVIQIGDYNLQVEMEASAQDTVPEQPAAEAKDAKKKGKKTSGLQKKRSEAPTRLEPAAKSDVDSTSMISLDDIERAARQQGGAKTRVVADVPTLVAISTQLAGQEFRLAGTEIIIGRTDENDVVVDHRSISRNHARVTHSDGRVTIHDLDSANGMKINDEYYKQSVLRRGDTVELGHVKLRYVEPGETFVYDPEEYAHLDSPDSDGSKSGSGKLVGIVVVLLVLAAAATVAVILATGSSDGPSLNSPNNPTETQVTPEPKPKAKAKKAKKPAKKAKKAKVAKKPAADPVASDAKKPPVTKTDTKELKALETQAKGQLKGKEWAAALETCRKVLKLAPKDPLGVACVQQAERELNIDGGLTQAEKHALGGRYQEAWKKLMLLEGLKKGHGKYAKFIKLRTLVNNGYATSLVTDAKRAYKRKNYREAIGLAEKALTITKNASGAKSLIKKAQKARQKVKKDKKPKAAEPKAVAAKPKEKKPKEPKAKASKPKEAKAAPSEGLPPGASNKPCLIIKAKANTSPAWRSLYRKGCYHYYSAKKRYGAALNGTPKQKASVIKSLKKFLRWSGRPPGNMRSGAKRMCKTLGGGC